MKKPQPPKSHKLTEAQRFWAFVEKTPTCWIWHGYVHRKGYGRFNRIGSNQAHRVAYELLVGPIPEGLTLDHLCKSKACVNPEHLEAVTNKVNTLRGGNACAMNARKTHCKYGHEFTPENTFEQYGGGRGCVTCNRKYKREWARKRRAA